MSLMMQMCMTHKQEKDEEMRRNDTFERALKMPQSEFERAVTRYTKDGVTDYAAIAEKFETTQEEVRRRGEDLRLW